MTLQNIDNQASQLNQKQIQILKKINKNFQQQYDEMLKDMYEKIVTPYINFSFSTKDIKMKNLNDALQFIQQNTKTIESQSITQILTQYKQQCEQQAPKAVQFTNHIQNSLINYIPYPVLNIDKQNEQQNQTQDEIPLTPLSALKTLIQQPIIKPFIPFASKSNKYIPQQEFLIPQEAENQICQIYDNYQLKDLQDLQQKAKKLMSIDSDYDDVIEQQQNNQLPLLQQETFTKVDKITNETQKFINFIEKSLDVLDFDSQIRNEAKNSLQNANYGNLLNFIKNKSYNEKIIDFINDNLYNLFDIEIIRQKTQFQDFIQKIQQKQLLCLSAFYNKQTFYEGISVVCIIDDQKVYFIDCNELINEMFMMRSVFQDQSIKKIILNKNWQKVIDKMMLQWRICIQGALYCQQTILDQIEDNDMSFRPIEEKDIQNIINITTKQVWFIKYEQYKIQNVKYQINIDYQSQINDMIQNINLAATVQEMNYQMFLFWCEINCRLFNLNNNFEISKQDLESFVKTNKISFLHQLPPTIKLHLIEINDLLTFSLEYFKSHQQNKTVQQVKQTFIPSKKYQFTNKTKTDFTDCLQKLGVFVESSASLDNQNMKEIMDQFIQLNNNMSDTLLIDQQIKQNKQENDMTAFNASINEINNLLGVDKIDVDELFKEYIK